MNRRSFLLGSGLTTAGLISSGWGESAKAEAAPIPDLGISALLADETPRSCRPEDPLAALMDGNKRFVAAWRKKNQATTMAARAEAMAGLWQHDCFLSADVLSTGQAPWAGILSCADSRVSPEWVFDAAPSDLFVVRSAGNTAFDDAIASMEFTVSALNTPLIMVMGHSGCGAVSAARNSDPLTPLLEQLVSPIRASVNDDETLEASIKANAVQAAKRLTERSTLLNAAVSAGNLKIVVSYFDISSGSVSLI